MPVGNCVAGSVSHTSLNVAIIYCHYAPLPTLIVQAARHTENYFTNDNLNVLFEIFKPRALNASIGFLG